MDVWPSSASAGRAAGPLPPGWWERALGPGERPPAGERPRGGPAGAEPARPGAAAAQPAWAAAAEQAVAAAAAVQLLPGPLPASWQEAFAAPFQPFTAAARERVAAAARERLPARFADAGPVAGTFAAGLSRHLARVAAHTLEHVLRHARSSAALAGPDSGERFADFIRRQSSPAGLAALFGEYPVLARLLGSAAGSAADAGLELLARFAADRSRLVSGLLGDADPGPLVALEPGLGDRHRRGRSVTLLSFADGRRVIYKPLDVESLTRFADVVGWLNERLPRAGLRAARALARPGYGWVEFIAGAPLRHRDDAEVFYFREGVLLAALYATCASDIHAENIIASADQPVLVDAESLFHPAPPAPHPRFGDPAERALAASVQQTALLPYPTFHDEGVCDQSGMGGGADEVYPRARLDWDPPASDQTRLAWKPGPLARARNRPHLGGQSIEPADHEQAVLEGFRSGYDAIARDKRGFSRLLTACADMPVRLIARPSCRYARVLDASTRPDALKDAASREQALAALAREGEAPAWAAIAEHEIADLRAGDIPLLRGRPASRDIWTSDEQLLPGLLEETGLSRALSRVAAMSEVDRADQEWIISASLASRRPVDGHRNSGLMPGPLTATSAEPERLLAAACGLADQIVARGKASRPHGAGWSRVNWLGLQPVEDARWLLLPLGAGLSHGYLGVALFLAQLADLTGIGRYAQEARRAVSELPGLWEILGGRDELLMAVGCGGLDGLGGICYGLARMATLLDDREIRGWAEEAAGMAGRASALPGPPGWAGGKAGCLAALAAVHAETGSAAAHRAAAACADELSELVGATGGRCVDGGSAQAAGFAAGPAGVGWALTRFAAVSGRPGHARAGQMALRTAGDLPAAAAADGWCRGLAGLLIARTCLPRQAGDAEQAAAALARRGVLRDLSLCHGEMGIAEALTVMAARGASGELAQERRRRAGLLLDAVNRSQRCCGTPGGVWTPGLLSGVAGIGYGLLRLGFAERVPSVLLLEPSPGRGGVPPPPGPQETTRPPSP